MFNLCLLLLPVAGFYAGSVIERDQLFDYRFSPSAAASARTRVERLSASLILVDFDRRRQWDDLVAMELARHDISAARGFLLSARAMLPTRDANKVVVAMHGDDDAQLELAALNVLDPPTRARYETNVPLLSRRSASGVPPRREPIPSLGEPRDFELLSGAMLADADADSLHFVLSGFGLGLGGEFTPRMKAGAAALIAASRREEYPSAFAEQARALIAASVSPAAFRAEAVRRAPRGVDPASYPVSAPAFRAALDPTATQTAKAALDEIGQMYEATSLTGATLLVTHARSLQDLPRLRLVAQAAGDRAVAAAKNLPRDGRLARAARGALTFSRELNLALLAVALAAAGLALIALGSAFQAIRGAFDGVHDVDVDSGELVHSFNAPWKPL